MSLNQESTSNFGHQPDHDHSVLLYESREEQFASTAPFIQNGLQAGEKCLYLFHDNTEDDVITALKERGVAVEAAIESGQLSLRPATELYLTDGAFDPERTAELLDTELSEIRDTEYTRLRAAGEMTWVTEHDVDIDRIEAYERQIDELYQDNFLIGLCQYHRSQFSSEGLDNVLQTHPQVTYEADRRVNLYYESQAEYGEGRTTEAVLDRKLETISAQKQIEDSLIQRERALSLLGQARDQLREAEPDEIERIAGEIIAEVIDPSLVSFWRYDSSTGQLQREVTRNTIGDVDPAAIVADLDRRTWDVFVENEAQEFTVNAESRVRGIVLPTGQHGVVLVGVPGQSSITEADLDFVTAVTEHTKAVLDNVTHERDLEAKNDRLREQNAKLERVNQINAVIREINQSLVDATTEAEVAQAVCELVVQETCVDFAWFGSYEPATETLTPTHDAGDGQGYLETLTLEDSWTTQEPSDCVATFREIETVQNIYDGPSLDQWQTHALKRGFRSVVGLPVCFDDSMYGVLSLYSATPEIFDEKLVTVLDELSDSVAHAINSIRRKQALVTGSVTELKVRVTDTTLDVVDFVSKNDCRVDIDEVLSANEGGFRVFATYQDVSPGEIRSFGTISPTIDELEVLSEGERTHTCECIVTEQCLISHLLTHNAVPQSVRVEDGEAHLVLQLPQAMNVRVFMEMFSTKYPSAEVVARDSREQSLRRFEDVDAQLDNELTERQREILTLAYHSGYFEQPRVRSTEEIADSLDVSRPTVSRHLREAERRIFSLLFEEER